MSDLQSAGEPIRVRPYRSVDAGMLSAVFYASVRTIARRHYAEDQVRAWAPDVVDLDEFGERRAATTTWVAEIAGEIGGFSDCAVDGHIGMLYVRPDFQRRGIARALLKHIEEIARSRGLDRLYTEASITARPVFIALGFAELSEQSVTRSGIALTNYRMEKRLV